MPPKCYLCGKAHHPSKCNLHDLENHMHTVKELNPLLFEVIRDKLVNTGYLCELCYEKVLDTNCNLCPTCKEDLMVDMFEEKK